VYAHCLFCNADLGRNEALEAFPVGRRLAYDAARGRLWVVCTRCARWNLTPLEERWEAIEQAERLFRGTRLRASTDNIGLVRLRDATAVVRVGRPVGPELALWRYGRVLARRRHLAIAKTVAKEVAVAGVEGFFYGPIAAVARLVVRLNEADPDYWTGEAAQPPGTARVPVCVSGHVLRLDVDLATVRVRLRPDGAVSVALPFGREVRTFADADALAALRPMLVTLNTAGAPPEQVSRALSRLTRAGAAASYLAALGARRSFAARRRSGRDVPDGQFPLADLPRLDRLALEMALHEEQERRALEGELAGLERAWRDAEEIAAIADNLVLPRGVQAAWEQLRRRVSS